MPGNDQEKAPPIMKVESVKVVFPSRKITNEDIMSLIRQHSEGNYGGTLDKDLKLILAYLERSGARERYWLGNDETPVRLMSEVVCEALEEAGCSREEIDLLVHVGVDRGFLEPGGSHLLAQALGMSRVHCFDLLDSCMSWVRALQLIYALFQTGTYKRAMIVNGEFNQTHKGGAGYPGIYNLKRREETEWTFPGYTVGEAATATILSHDTEKKWEFHFSSRTDLADLCTIPTQGYESYCSSSKYVGLNGPGLFTSFGEMMHEIGKKEVVAVFKKLNVPVNEIRAIFPHASSTRAWDEAAKKLGVQHLLYHIYPRYGNLVSASIPAGIALAITEGRIKWGDRIVGWAGSAGMSFSAFSFVY